jgi:predicted amidophosphoribosyltransferase
MSVPRCRDCPPAEIDTARAPFRFDGPARQAVHRLKFSGWRGVGSALSLAMAEVEGLPSVEVVTWVPLARRRLAERGFDQARVLATGVARRTETPCVGLLTRARSTGPQAKRDAVARRMAMRGAFAVRDRDGRHGSRCGASAAAGWSHLGAPGGGRSSIFLSVLRGEA